MKKIRILYITCFGSMQGGGQRSLYLLIRHLDKERFCPFLVVPEAGDLKAAVEALGVAVFVLKPARLRSLNVAALVRTHRALARILEETQADIVSTDSVRETFYARHAGRRRGARILLHLRVTDSAAWVDRMLYGLVDRMIAVSRAAARRFERWDRQGKVSVVYNGVELDALAAAPPRPADGVLRLGYFGRLEERKGIDVLVRAVRRLKDAPVSVSIFGEGRQGYTRYLKELAAGDGRIVFEGFVADAVERMRRLDAVILPSRHGEGLSRALIEAMALGRPVIVSDIPSNPEVVGGELEAFIFRNGDETDLARLLADLMARPGQLMEAGRKARQRAEACFDLVKNTRLIEDVYSGLARRVPVPQPAVSRILVVNLGGIGDLFLSSPALRALRRHFAQACLVFCGVPRTAAFARSLGCFDDVRPFTGYEEGGRRFVLGWGRSFWRLALALRRERFDVAVNMRTLHSLTGAWKMALFFWLVGARRRVGRDTDGRGFFLTVKVPETTRGEKHEMEYDLDTVRALGVAVDDASLRVDIPEQARQAVSVLLGAQGIDAGARLIGVNPGGAPSHRWPLAHFGTAMKQILDICPGVLVVTGGKGEEGLGEELEGLLKGYRVVNAAGRLSWEELAAFLERCRLFVTNDTGPMHVAAALKTPMVALFGPGYLTRFDPRILSDKAIVLHERVSCAPCDRMSCRDLWCLKRITPGGVVTAARELLERA